jgi:hypothetical protein
MFSAGVLILTILHLLRELFGPGDITRDRLFGVAAAYLLIGLLWCYFYALIEFLAPGSFVGLGSNRHLHVAQVTYLSFNIVTSVGLTDIEPVRRGAQALVILQAVSSVLFMAFIIARLVAMYASRR